MVLRIEYILLLSLLVLLGFLVVPKNSSLGSVKSDVSTELTFENFSLIELSEEGITHQMSSSLAIKDKSYFKLSDINITYDKNQHILAKNALYKDKFIYLNDDVSLRKENGFSFKTKKLVYSIAEQRVNTAKPFSLELNQSKVVGDNLQYDLALKRISADHIEAKIILE